MQDMKKRPWNRVDQAVYSVASKDGNTDNMNICTYACQVSMRPKRYIVALFKGTKTMSNIESYPYLVLQILSTSNIDLVRRLGKTSGNTKDKLKGLQYRLMDYNGFKVIIDAIAVIEMKILTLTDAGDHFLALCDVISYKNISSGEVLMLSHLRDKRIISI
jgi:flavin reductase (DIM6/NTAB) family NADH-FMN oxidoreductase RutF